MNRKLPLLFWIIALGVLLVSLGRLFPGMWKEPPSADQARLAALGDQLRREVDRGAGIKGEAYQAIMLTLEAGEFSSEVKERALFELTQAIRSTPPEEALKVAGFLKSSHPKVRETAMAVLRDADPTDPMAAPSFVAGLSDPDAMVRYHAIGALYHAVEKAGIKAQEETPGFPALSLYEKEPERWTATWIEWWEAHGETMPLK